MCDKTYVSMQLVCVINILNAIVLVCVTKQMHEAMVDKVRVRERWVSYNKTTKLQQ
jgi:high-affinity nickel permease